MAAHNSRRYIAPVETSQATVGRASLLIALSALGFGSISVLTLLITDAGLSLMTAMAWRYVIASFVLAAIAPLDQLRSIPRFKILRLILIGGFGQAMITYMSLYALNYIPVGPLAFLFYTYPAWVALLGAVRRTERLTLVRVIALTMALAGVTIMIGAPTAEKLHPIGTALALGSALLYTIYLPTLQHVQQGIPAMLSAFLLVVGAGLSFTLVTLLAGNMQLPGEPTLWFNLILLSMVSTVVAFSALIKGLAVLGPVRTSIIATVEPFFTAILGVLILNDRLTAATLTGGVLIAGAVILIQWSSARVEATA
ncbi:MAG TPA: DMT family transporter [Gemmatimonadaceae bacterium]|nr:DMT family transporter [Gemmatimonadaceae bacterium]